MERYISHDTQLFRLSNSPTSFCSSTLQLFNSSTFQLFNFSTLFCIIAFMSLKRNIPLFYLHRFLNEFLLIAPILIPFYQFNRFGIWAFYTAQAIYAFTVLLLEVPSGYLADVIGRRKTLIIGACFLPTGLLLYGLGNSLWVFWLAEFMLAVGNSMRSGSDSALLYDSFINLKCEDAYQGTEGRGHQFARIGTAVASVAGGLLAARSIYLPFWINVPIALAILPVSLMMIEPARHAPKSKRPLHEILVIAGNALKNHALRPFLLFFGLLGSVCILSLWAFFIYYQSIRISIAWFGVLFAVYQTMGAIGAARSQALSARLGGRFVVTLSLFLAPILILLGGIQSICMLPLIMLHPLLWNLAVPVLFNQINLKTASRIRATVLSLANMGLSFAYVLTAPLFGLAAERIPLRLALWGLAAFFTIFSIPLLASMKREWKTEPGAKG